MIGNHQYQIKDEIDLFLKLWKIIFVAKCDSSWWYWRNWRAIVNVFKTEGSRVNVLNCQISIWPVIS